MATVKANVYGVYNHGKLVGKTNPKAVTVITVSADSVKTAFRKLGGICNGAFYSVISVEGEMK